VEVQHRALEPQDRLAQSRLEPGELVIANGLRRLHELHCNASATFYEAEAFPGKS